MTFLNADLYDALKSVGADDAIARKAAESMAAPDRLVTRIDEAEAQLGLKIEAGDSRLETKIDAVDKRLSQKIDAVDQKLGTRIDGLEKQVRIMMWMLGLNIGATVGLYALFLRQL